MNHSLHETIRLRMLIEAHPNKQGIPVLWWRTAKTPLMFPARIKMHPPFFLLVPRHNPTNIALYYALPDNTVVGYANKMGSEFGRSIGSWKIDEDTFEKEKIEEENGHITAREGQDDGDV